MRIPNNIGLVDHSPLEGRLYAYQLKFREWWRERGPGEFLDRPMSLRTPSGKTSGGGWTRYQQMTPGDYHWGLFTVPDERTQIAFGEQRGDAAWTRVPAELHRLLLEHVSVQADVENAAIEQSRTLTRSAPSGADLQNLFQFFLEEGRHTWAMVHLLLEHFGHDGEVEADKLLERMSGDPDHPRLLDAFNYHTDDWISHYMWCFLADRVGKYQVQAVTDSAFLPLAASARFMMLEEPLHIGFGLSGLERILHRSAEITRREDREDIFEAGAIPLPVFQKYLNFWAPKTYDLFGHDSSNRSRDLYRLGIRRPRNFAPQELENVHVDVRNGAALLRTAVGPESATNAIMRRQFIAEVQRIVERWNDILARYGLETRLSLPHERFARNFGPCRGLAIDVDGTAIEDGGESRIAGRLPSAAEITQVCGLMQQQIAPGQCAPWIAPPGVRLEQLVAPRGQSK
jgi:benzoyl-CoA 2,3-dioxygenase component B